MGQQFIQQNSPSSPKDPKNIRLKSRSSLEAIKQKEMDSQAPARAVSSFSPVFDHTESTPGQYIEIVPGFRMTLNEADKALNLYRSFYTSYFPFVPIPVTMTALEMDSETPFLLRTILQVTAPVNHTIQKKVQTWFREHIAQHVLVEGERRLEVLQAIIVFVAWGDFQFYIEPQATDLLQLSEAIMLDLGLNRPPGSLGGAVRLSFVPEATRKLRLGHKRESHNLDDKRTMLGCYYINSLIATLFRRIRCFGNTPYLTRCCEAVLEAQEYESDQLLVSLVRMQRLLARISDSFPGPDVDETPGPFLDAPLHMVMATTRKEIDALVQSQPPEVKNNALFWIHYYGVLIRLYEPAIHMQPLLTSGNPLESTHRTEALWGCLQAAKDFFVAYTAIPLAKLGSMPLMPTTYLSFAFVTSSRILLLDDSDWSAHLARKTFDFATACQSLSDRLYEADRLAQVVGGRRKFDDAGKSVLYSTCMKVQWIREWYTAKTSLADDRTNTAPTSLSTNQAMDLDQSLQESSFVPIELDQEFWQVLLDLNGTSTWSG
ncbi:hypothetical protein ASPZODRAFT_127282 [Penicilliopsis zonata CBS 506.65]|uniref:Transcription factor domain-containing protein n=1 Tax=Penicilliopsis zonata CBS 506.65 TaxID=1073090 RepID=A0A1L9SVW7_9EURO|nr:hypothetical protein ASPZODRAFT_127282 [Penicilliopsis zonata CBS 506.65]OJJ51247.1 hypothetical protein ASPZODRAFT_127282 [Penicilliopsis zonata CBS 506.65]